MGVLVPSVLICCFASFPSRGNYGLLTKLLNCLLQFGTLSKLIACGIQWKALGTGRILLDAMVWSRNPGVGNGHFRKCSIPSKPDYSGPAGWFWFGSGTGQAS